MHKFKQAVHFPGKKGEKDKNGLMLPDEPGHSFKFGDVVEVPDEVKEHPYFEKLVEAGLVEEAKPGLPKEDLNERNKRLADKLAPKADPDASQEDEKPKKGKKSKE